MSNNNNNDKIKVLSNRSKLKIEIWFDGGKLFVRSGFPFTETLGILVQSRDVLLSDVLRRRFEQELLSRSVGGLVGSDGKPLISGGGGGKEN